jgi:hypothetical protein
MAAPKVGNRPFQSFLFRGREVNIQSIRTQITLADDGDHRRAQNRNAIKRTPMALSATLPRLQCSSKRLAGSGAFPASLACASSDAINSQNGFQVAR